MKVFEKARQLVDRDLAKVGAVVALATASASSFAVTTVDITAATDGISAAQVAVLGVLAAMITMGAAVYGLKKVLRLIGR